MPWKHLQKYYSVFIFQIGKSGIIDIIYFTNKDKNWNQNGGSHIKLETENERLILGAVGNQSPIHWTTEFAHIKIFNF